MARRPNAGTQQRWLDLVRQWQQSRLSVREFCCRRQLSEPSFYAWRRLLRQRGFLDQDASADAVATATTPTFVKVTVTADAPTPPAIELVVAAGRLLRVSAGFDPDLLRQLLRVLEEPSC